MDVLQVLANKYFNQENFMNKKVCVIVAGRWGKNHIKTLHSLGCLAGIVEANSDALPECKEKYPDVRTFASIRDAIKKDFDGFTVATPAETHFEIAEFIISHKRHLLVEKPLTLKAKKARHHGAASVEWDQAKIDAEFADMDI